MIELEVTVLKEVRLVKDEESVLDDWDNGACMLVRLEVPEAVLVGIGSLLDRF